MRNQQAVYEDIAATVARLNELLNEAESLGIVTFVTFPLRANMAHVTVQGDQIQTPVNGESNRKTD